ncbi:unnamed protein product [Larinioides sclopetarius]|uniref:Macro domain-containing protein n=1 Tax=Larinioides sclopetarius TaxID=280406 RepID=A0AAV1Z410_9ARAC
MRLSLPCLRQELHSIQELAFVLKVMDFLKEKVKYMDMDRDEKRAMYLCKNSYVTLDEIPTWREYSKNLNKVDSSPDNYEKDEILNSKVSLFVGDITTLEIDSIVNSTNTGLLGGFYTQVDGAIHSAAGGSLLAECLSLNSCPRGEAKFTGGYQLPARYVIHTAGPFEEESELLRRCYLNSLDIAKRKGWKTIAFPCISTGVYAYPKEKAAHVALKTVREFLQKNPCAVGVVL